MKTKILIALLILGIIVAVAWRDTPIQRMMIYCDGYEDGYNAGFSDSNGKPIPIKDRFPHAPVKQ